MDCDPAACSMARRPQNKVEIAKSKVKWSRTTTGLSEDELPKTKTATRTTDPLLLSRMFANVRSSRSLFRFIRINLKPRRGRAHHRVSDALPRTRGKEESQPTPTHTMSESNELVDRVAANRHTSKNCSSVHVRRTGVEAARELFFQNFAAKLLVVKNSDSQTFHYSFQNRHGTAETDSRYASYPPLRTKRCRSSCSLHLFPAFRAYPLIVSQEEAQITSPRKRIRIRAEYERERRAPDGRRRHQFCACGTHRSTRHAVAIEVHTSWRK